MPDARREARPVTPMEVAVEAEVAATDALAAAAFWERIGTPLLLAMLAAQPQETPVA